MPENYVIAREAVAGVRHGRLSAVLFASIGVVWLALALLLFHHEPLRWVAVAVSASMLLNAWGQLRRRQRILDGVTTWDAARFGGDR